MKLKNKFLLAVQIILFAILGSCAPVMYSNLGYNVPMFQEKGEVMVSLARANSWNEYLVQTEASGLALQVANSFNDKFAWHSSYYSLNNVASNNSSDYWKSNGNYFELGIGRFGKTTNQKFGYEIFGGMGYGGVNNSFASNSFDVEKVKANFIKPYIQPSFGFISSYVDIIFTPRFGLVSYHSKEIIGNDIENIRMAEAFFEERGTTAVFEPGVTIRAGFNGVKLQFQYAYSTFSQVDDVVVGVNNKYFSLGAYFLISSRYK